METRREKNKLIIFHIKIQVKKMKIDALFNSGSYVNLITTDLVKKLGIKAHDHPIPYRFGWVNTEVEIKVTK